MFDGLALGTMGGTYGAAPLACATANATLDVIVEENLLENATQRGAQLVEVRPRAAPQGLSSCQAVSQFLCCRTLCSAGRARHSGAVRNIAGQGALLTCMLGAHSVPS